MNREIKFRAWDSHLQIMINPYCELKDGRFWGEDCTNTGYSVAHEHVMQYTGLKDKEGVEIYEGDYIKFNIPTFSGEYVSVICSVGKSKYGWYPFADPSYQMDMALEIEVIGNIYQHPNLLPAELP